MAVTHHKSMHLDNQLQVAGTVTVSGALVSGNLHVASAANGVCGLLSVPAGGTASVSSTKVKTSSRIILSARSPVALVKGLSPVITTVATGSGFSVRLDRVQTAGTIHAAAGLVSWLVLNK